jgi:transposase
VTQAEALIAGHEPDAVIADQGYDSDALVGAIERRGAEAVIPPRSNRQRPRTIDRHLYRERNLAERFIGRIKRYRRVATRSDKTARNFLAFVHVASIMTLLL